MTNQDPNPPLEIPALPKKRGPKPKQKACLPTLQIGEATEQAPVTKPVELDPRAALVADVLASGKAVAFTSNDRCYVFPGDGSALEHWRAQGHPLHRSDGPAVLYPTGEKAWMIDDIQLDCASDSQFQAMTQAKLFFCLPHKKDIIVKKSYLG